MVVYHERGLPAQKQTSKPGKHRSDPQVKDTLKGLPHIEPYMLHEKNPNLQQVSYGKASNLPVAQGKRPQLTEAGQVSCKGIPENPWHVTGTNLSAPPPPLSLTYGHPLLAWPWHLGVPLEYCAGWNQVQATPSLRTSARFGRACTTCSSPVPSRSCQPLVAASPERSVDPSLAPGGQAVTRKVEKISKIVPCAGKAMVASRPPSTKGQRLRLNWPSSLRRSPFRRLHELGKPENQKARRNASINSFIRKHEQSID